MRVMKRLTAHSSERAYDMPGLVTPVADERDGLLAYLDQQRLILRLTAYGLTDEQGRATPSASAHSIAGLIKHVAAAERLWKDAILQHHREWSSATHEASFRLTSDETLASVLELYDQAAQETDAVIAEIPDLGQPVPAPQWTAWVPIKVKDYSVRWVLLHLITETARHAGHADIIRETLDGAKARSLMAAAEGWHTTRVRPWKASSPKPTHVDDPTRSPLSAVGAG